MAYGDRGSWTQISVPYDGDPTYAVWCGHPHCGTYISHEIADCESALSAADIHDDRHDAEDNPPGPASGTEHIALHWGR